jgi:FkbM family methyltransferase
MQPFRTFYWYAQHAVSFTSFLRLCYQTIRLGQDMRYSSGQVRLANSQTRYAYPLKFMGQKHTFYLRRQDLPMLHEIFRYEQYAIPNLHLHADATVIDAGAHIGLFSLYMNLKYKIMHPICLEPSAKNYAVLETNMRHLPKAELLKTALSDTVGLAYFDESNLGYNHHLDQIGTQVSTTNITALLHNLPNKHINLLKIDIEGGEERVFEAQDLSWLGSVDALLIELHANYSAERLATRLQAYGFTINTLQGKDYLIYAFRTDTI